MSKTKPLNQNPLFLLGACFLGILLYYPVLNGAPIWDDSVDWFRAHVMSSEYPYSMVWSRFAWPLSVTVQKFLLSVFGYQFNQYHAFNLLLHLLNSLLVLQLGTQLKWPKAEWIFLLFILHPANLIAVAWMTQVKTLLCFFFSFLTLLTYLRAEKDRRWMYASWALFFCALACKASALMLPLLFLIPGLKFHVKKRAIVWLLPFFIFSSFSGYRIVTSLGAGIDPDQAKTAEKVILPHTESKVLQALPHPAMKATEVPASAPAASPLATAPKTPSDANLIQKGFQAVSRLLRTSAYYFWKAYLPLGSHPVKEPERGQFHGSDALRILSLIALFALAWFEIGFLKRSWLMHWIPAAILIFPVLGLVPTPFMNISWVSDQHLYLALPFLLVLPFYYLEKVKAPRLQTSLGLVLAIFLAMGLKATPYYKNEISFYTESLNATPGHVAIANNLAVALMNLGQSERAAYVIEETLFQIDQDESLKASKFLPILYELRNAIKEARKTKDTKRRS
ncbi:MAG: hypothetical protein JNL01_00435 [Bdellovibrionales bacterium]|nr:hypothetical protein [Bdellovibrionales bacterium]